MTKIPQEIFKILSLARWQRLAAEDRAPTPAWVGGRVLQREGETCLEGQGLRYVLRGLAAPAAADGDHVIVRVQAANGDELRVDALQTLTSGASVPVRDLAHPEIAPTRHRFMQLIRRILDGRGLLGVETPSLYKANAGEPMIVPLRTKLRWGSREEERLLVTSPELYHKRLILLGWTDFYEIKTVYRNGEKSPLHDIEFQMLEWYRVFATPSDLLDDIEAILEAAFAEGLFRGERAPTRRLTMADVFARACGAVITPGMSEESWRRLVKDQGLTEPAGLVGVNDFFHYLFIEKVEPWVRSQTDGLLVIEGFPPSAAALSRLRDDGWADRFEVYWRGLELANGYDELTAPDEQKRRLERDAAEADWPVDIGFAREMTRGFPRAAGCALGLDRLLMAGLEATSIDQVRLFFQNPGA
jgi:lysyl-tRNA synthetase class 2